MVIKATSIDTTAAAYVDRSSSFTKSGSQSTNNNMTEQMQLLRDYFAKIDGSPDAADSFKDAFKEVFHPDVVFEYHGEQLQYDEIVAAFQTALNKGVCANLVDIKDNGDGTATMTLSIHAPCLNDPSDNEQGSNQDMLSGRIVHFRDGKVIRVHATKEYEHQFGRMMHHFKTLSNKELTNNNMKEQMQMMKNLFAMIDGSPEAAKSFKDAFEKVYHPDVVFEYPGGKLSFDGIYSVVQATINKGGYANLVNIYDNGNGTATMALCFHLPDTDGPSSLSHRIVYFKDGKVIRIHPTEKDAQQSKTMLQHCIALSNDELAKKYAIMIACFDGSPNAYEKAEPIIDEIFDRGLVVDHGVAEGLCCKDFSSFKKWVATFSREQNVAKMEGEVEVNNEGSYIRVTIRNIADGVDLGAVTQIGKIKNGKIVHWSAAPSVTDELGFDKLVSSVAAHEKGMVGNVQRLKDYLAALDGSFDAYEKFEPHIDRVLARDLVLEDGDGNLKMNYEEFISMIHHKYLPNGCYPTLESVEVNEDECSLTVVINNHLPGEAGDVSHQVLYYGDDDLIHRVTSTQLCEMCERVNEFPSY